MLFGGGAFWRLFSLAGASSIHELASGKLFTSPSLSTPRGVLMALLSLTCLVLNVSIAKLKVNSPYDDVDEANQLRHRLDNGSRFSSPRGRCELGSDLLFYFPPPPPQLFLLKRK